MRTKYEQATRSRVITLTAKLSSYELTDLVVRMREVEATNSTWVQFMAFMEAALENTDE
jgi:hypothetical protein